MNNTRILPFFVFAMIVAVFSSGVSAEEAREDARRLTVNGSGEVSAKPDKVIINFSVDTKGPEAAETIAENAEKTNAVLEKLKSMLGEEDKITTSRYNLSPVNEYNNETRKTEFKGYNVTNQVKVESMDIEEIGNIIDAAVKAGANGVDGLSFEASNRNELRRDALSASVKDARLTADTVAEASGVKITGIREITASYDYPGPVYMEYSMRSTASDVAAAPPTPIEPGDISIRASVTIVYEIE